MFFKKPFFLFVAVSFLISGYTSSHVWIEAANISIKKPSKNDRKCAHQEKCRQSQKKIHQEKIKEKPKNFSKPEPIKPGNPIKKNQLPSGYNYSGRVDVKGKWDFTLSSSFIYWQMIEDQLNFLWDFKINQNILKKVDWKNHYKPGFQVEFGVYFRNHDDWKLDAEYIRYHVHNHLEKSLVPNASEEVLVVPYWAGGSAGHNSKAEGHMHLSYDAWHLTMSRPYYLGKHLICNLGFGLRAWTIDNELNTSIWKIPDDQGVSIQTDSHHQCKAWAIGPRALFEGQFLLGRGWQFIGKGGLSVLYRNNHERSKVIPYGPEQPPLTSLYIDNSNLLSPETELGIGLGWGTYMNHDRQHIEFNARYDWQVFWNHKMILDYQNNFLVTDLHSAILNFHGLTITGALDF